MELSYPHSSTVFNMLKTFDSEPQRISRKDRKAQWSTPFSLTSWMLPSNNWTFPWLLGNAKPTIQNRAFKSLKHLGGWGQSRKWLRSHIISIHLITEHIYYLWWRSRYKSNIFYSIGHFNWFYKYLQIYQDKWLFTIQPSQPTWATFPILSEDKFLY